MAFAAVAYVVAAAPVAECVAAALACDSAEEMAMDELSRTRRRIARAARMEAHRRVQHERRARRAELRRGIRRMQRERQLDLGRPASVVQTDPVQPEAEVSRRSAATVAEYLAAWTQLAATEEEVAAALVAALVGLPGAPLEAPPDVER